MGEQTILCGLLPNGSTLFSIKWLKKGMDFAGYASQAYSVRMGKQLLKVLNMRGITHMMDRLSNPAKIKGLWIVRKGIKGYYAVPFSTRPFGRLSMSGSISPRLWWRCGQMMIKKPIEPGRGGQTWRYWHSKKLLLGSDKISETKNFMTTVF